MCPHFGHGGASFWFWMVAVREAAIMWPAAAAEGMPSLVVAVALTLSISDASASSAKGRSLTGRFIFFFRSAATLGIGSSACPALGELDSR